MRAILKWAVLAFRFIWSWAFLATANVVASLVTLIMTCVNALEPVSLECNINNVVMAVSAGESSALQVMQQVSTSAFALEHNVPDFSSPWIVVVLSLLWIFRTVKDTVDGDGATWWTNLLISGLAVLAIGVGFFSGVSNSAALSRAGWRVMTAMESIELIKPEALRLASDEGLTDESQKPVRACAIALDMLSARRLHYCSAGSSAYDCLVKAREAPEQAAAIDRETRRWLFSPTEGPIHVAQ